MAFMAAFARAGSMGDTSTDSVRGPTCKQDMYGRAGQPREKEPCHMQRKV